MVEVGFGQADIISRDRFTLEWIRRPTKPPIDCAGCPLLLRCLVFRDRNKPYFLLSYDLLGIPPTVEQIILERLEQGLDSVFARSQCVLLATHNHSGPPLGLLCGEPGPDPEYVRSLADRSLEAVRCAIDRLETANMLTSERRLPGLTYNRRALLSDGRVSISLHPDLPVIKRGPLDDKATIIVWRSLKGANIAGLIHFACHGVAVLSQSLGPDIPGELAERVSRLLGAPCLFLQGAAGDVNPTTLTASRLDLMDWIDRASDCLEGIQQSLRPANLSQVRTVTGQLPMHYTRLPGRQKVEQDLVNLERISQDDIKSPDLEEALRTFKNTMNLPPTEPLDPALARCVALALIESSRKTLAAVRSGRLPSTPPLQISIWRLGDHVLAFLACELFAATGARMRALAEDLTVLPVSCLTPLLGYLPDQEALNQGGYEVNDAWRFYGHPGPFEPETEPRLVNAVYKLLEQLRE